LELIAKSGLTQNHWAMKLGLSRGHWSEIVNGKHPYPSGRTRDRLLEAFGVPFEALFDIESGPAPADMDARTAVAERYLFDRELGRGGMGTVYLARDVRLGRPVAVKVITAEAVSGIGVEQFLKEIGFTTQLYHPHILPLYDAGVAAGQPYYVTAYMREGSLRDLLARQHRLPATQVATLIAGIAAALSHAHAHGILHCDIKPENVLLAGDHAYLADFGVARAVYREAFEWDRPSSLDSSAGTPAYVSPEQAAGERDLDGRSDLYSLGCLAFEMLAGRPPFRGANALDTVSQRFREPAPDVRAFAPEAPAALADVIAQALSFDRRDRQPGVHAFASQLARAASPGVLGAVSRGAFVVSRAASRVGHRVSPAGVARVGGLLAAFVQDTRHALRGLRGHAGFAVAAVATLALGLGATLSMWTVVNGLYLAPLPYANAGRLVHVQGPPDALYGVPYPDIADLREAAPSLADVAAWQGWAARLRAEDGTLTRLFGASASADFFALLGVRPVLGRFFTPDEDLAGHAPVVVLSHDTWRRHFGGRAEAIGETVPFDAERYTVVGVAPPDFVDPVAESALGRTTVAVWRAHPPVFDSAATDRTWIGFWAVARLAPGATRQQAQAEVRAILRARHQELSADARPTHLDRSVVTVREPPVGRARPTLASLLGAALLLLMIACGNVANLLLSRGSARQREIAMRAALGASRGRLISQLVTESVVLAGLGAVAGLGLAALGSRLVVRLATGSLPRAYAVALDWRVVMFAVGVTLLTALAFGLLPALQVTSRHLGASVRESGRGNVARRGKGLRSAVVVAETALALMLLVAAGLLGRSFWALSRVDPGFQTRSISTMSLGLDADALGGRSGQLAAVTRLLDNARGTPGVLAAGGITDLPLSGATNSTRVRRADAGEDDEGGLVSALVRAVTPDYFDVVRVPVLRGRPVDPSDVDGAPEVALVNESFARAVYPNQDPLGQAVVVRGVAREIVGVVRDVHEFRLDRAGDRVLYTPYAQEKEGWMRAGLNVVVRTGVADGRADAALRAAVRRSGAGITLGGVGSLERVVDRHLAEPRLRGAIVAAVAAFGILLTALGIGAVTAYAVAQRIPEMGLRLALGATHRTVIALVVADSGRLMLAGTGIGLALALGAARLLRRFLFGVPPFDPLTFAAIALLVVGVGTAASYLPARRAGRVDPAAMLRVD
jgi:predicted permease